MASGCPSTSQHPQSSLASGNQVFPAARKTDVKVIKLFFFIADKEAK